MGTKLERIMESSATTPKPEFTSLYHLTSLVSRLKHKAYKPLPSLRVFIPKANGKKLIGHYRYYGVSHKINKLSAFLHYVQRYLFKVLNRRSHKKSYTWDGYIDMLKAYPLAKPKIYVKLF